MAPAAVCNKRRRGIRQLSVLALALAAGFAGLLLVGPSVRAQREVSGKEALAVLQRCYQCHGPALQMSKLDLSTPEGMLKGGEKGPAVIPGNAEATKSRCVIQRRA